MGWTFDRDIDRLSGGTPELLEILIQRHNDSVRISNTRHHQEQMFPYFRQFTWHYRIRLHVIASDACHNVSSAEEDAGWTREAVLCGVLPAMSIGGPWPERSS